MSLLPGAEPYTADGGRVGVLCCHGFTGTPQPLRELAERYAAAGFTVSLPLLPGHGTRWQDLALTRWEDWYAAVDRAFCRLTERCDTVAVVGLSMGGTLALRLAQQHGTSVAGLVLINPSLTSDNRLLAALPVLRRTVRTVKGVAGDIKKPGGREVAYDRTPLAALHSLTRFWRIVAADLPKVTQPVLLFRSLEDHVVEPSSGRLLLSRISSTEVEERLCEDSYHVATLDHDAAAVLDGSLDFVRRLAPAVMPSAVPPAMPPVASG